MSKVSTELNQTAISLAEDVRGDLSDLLNALLADLSDLSSMVQEAHWNVKGSAFITLHKLFEDIYGALDGERDDLAERITTLGGFAAGTQRRVAAATSLEELPTSVAAPMGYVLVLSERLSEVANRFRAAIRTAGDLGDENTADLLTGISRELDKSLWFLEAHMRQ